MPTADGPVTATNAINQMLDYTPNFEPVSIFASRTTISVSKSMGNVLSSATETFFWLEGYRQCYLFTTRFLS